MPWHANKFLVSIKSRELNSSNPSSTLAFSSFSNNMSVSVVARAIYLSLMAVACICCFCVTLMPKFDQPEYRKVRGIMYIILGLSCGIMFIMFSFMDEYISPNTAWIYALGGYIYIQGAIIYMIRCPERCAPGKFDFCGASH